MTEPTDNVLELIRLTHEEARLVEKLASIHKAKAETYRLESVVNEEYYQNQIALGNARQRASDLYDYRGLLCEYNTTI